MALYVPVRVAACSGYAPVYVAACSGHAGRLYVPYTLSCN